MLPKISSQMLFLMQVKALGLAMVKALNMSDQSERFGIRIDIVGLSKELHIPMVSICGCHNLHIHKLIDRLHQRGETLGSGPLLEPSLDHALLEVSQERIHQLIKRHVQLPLRLQNRLTW